MKRTLLISLFAIALSAGTAVAGEGHDHDGGQGHESGAGDGPETEAFYPGETGEDHGDPKEEGHSGHDHSEPGEDPDEPAHRDTSGQGHDH